MLKMSKFAVSGQDWCLSNLASNYKEKDFPKDQEPRKRKENYIKKYQVIVYILSAEKLEVKM